MKSISNSETVFYKHLFFQPKDKSSKTIFESCDIKMIKKYLLKVIGIIIDQERKKNFLIHEDILNNICTKNQINYIKIYTIKFILVKTENRKPKTYLDITLGATKNFYKRK